VNRLFSFTSQALHLFALAFFALTLLYSLAFVVLEPKYTPSLTIIVLLAGMIGVIILACFLQRYLNTASFVILLCLVTVGVRLAWMLTFDTEVVQDFKRMYDGAVAAANGDYSFAQEPYFTTWVYQLGFTMYQAMVIKLFGTGTLAIKLLNIVYCLGITLFIYRIAAHLFNEFSGRIAGIVFALYVPNIVMSSVLTNQHLATFLFYGAFYLLAKKGITHRYAWIGVGVLLAFGDIMRPIGAVILLALGIFLFVIYFIGKEKAKKRVILGKLVGILGIFYLVHYIFSYSLIAAGVTQYQLSNRDPYWKFVLGFNHETSGRFSVPDYNLVNQYEVGEERFALEKELIRERLESPTKLLQLVEAKFKFMWGTYDESPYWGLEGYEHPKLKEALFLLEKLMYISISFFALLSIVALMRGEARNEHLFLLLVILGYVAVHFLIEIQTRYRYFIIPSFVIIHSYGVYMTATYFKQKIPFLPRS
jgi:4-amino-4-deoxy-L-arabinose transferase-like glycosyltransferase